MIDVTSWRSLLFVHLRFCFCFAFLFAFFPFSFSPFFPHRFLCVLMIHGLPVCDASIPFFSFSFSLFPYRLRREFQQPYIPSVQFILRAVIFLIFPFFSKCR